jgi:hypothetical protein
MLFESWKLDQAEWNFKKGQLKVNAKGAASDYSLFVHF